MPKQKYYVVWCGLVPGIYLTWAECEAQVKGVKGAAFKSFRTRAEAAAAYAAGPPERAGRGAGAGSTGGKGRMGDFVNPPDWRHDTVLPLPPEVSAAAWAVDAACSGNPGPMEYRGVDLATGAEVFRYGPVHGTNNIGEFLAIVHALALLVQRGECKTVYSDSRNALLWVRQGKCSTKLKRDSRTENVYHLIARAEEWLAAHSWQHIPVLKWRTEKWGEVPADFGRK